MDPARIRKFSGITDVPEKIHMRQILGAIQHVDRLVAGGRECHVALGAAGASPLLPLRSSSVHSGNTARRWLAELPPTSATVNTAVSFPVDSFTTTGRP